MSDRFKPYGKEVLRDGAHFLDCATANDAITVTVLLNLADSTLAGRRVDTEAHLTWAGERLA